MPLINKGRSIGEVRAKYFCARNAIYIPTNDSSMYDPTIEAFVEKLEWGHHVVDFLTNIGKDILLDNVLGNVEFAILGITNPYVARELGNNLVTIELLLETMHDSYLILDETFSLLCGVSIKQEGFDSREVDVLADHYLRYYPYCKELYQIGLRLRKRFELGELFVLFRKAANIPFDQNPCQRIPLPLEKNPDQRIFMVLKYCDKLVSQTPDINFENLVQKLDEYLSQHHLESRSHRRKLTFRRKYVINLIKKSKIRLDNGFVEWLLSYLDNYEKRISSDSYRQHNMRLCALRLSDSNGKLRLGTRKDLMRNDTIRTELGDLWVDNFFLTQVKHDIIDGNLSIHPKKYINNFEELNMCPNYEWIERIGERLSKIMPLFRNNSLWVPYRKSKLP